MVIFFVKEMGAKGKKFKGGKGEMEGGIRKEGQ